VLRIGVATHAESRWIPAFAGMTDKRMSDVVRRRSKDAYPVKPGTIPIFNSMTQRKPDDRPMAFEARFRCSLE